MTIEPVRQRASAWWRERSGRERTLLTILAALLLLWIAVAFVARPLLDARATALNQIRTYQSLGYRLRRAGSISAIGGPQRSGTPVAILSTSAAEIGLAPVVTPDAARYHVVIADASYDALIRWIAEVERSSNLRFVAMRIERRPAAGMVSADLTVRP